MFIRTREVFAFLLTIALGAASILALAAPGDDPACVTVSGSTTASSSSTLKFDIGGETPCEQHDQATYENLTVESSTFKIRLITGYSPSGGELFNVLNWTTLTGTFSEPFDTSEAVLPEGLAWDFSQLYTTGEISISGSLAADAQQMPIPIWMLSSLAVGILGLAYRSRNK